MNQRWVFHAKETKEFEINQFFQMCFTLKFNVWLVWRDARLKYEFLRANRFQNEVPGDLAAQIWTPAFNFDNHYERENEKQVIKFDPLPSLIMLEKDGPGKASTLSERYEGRMYTSNETRIVWRSRHFVKFKCDFKLYFFPFDHSTCYVKVCLEQFSP